MKMTMKHTSCDTDKGKPNYAEKYKYSPTATFSRANLTYTGMEPNPGFLVERRNPSPPYIKT
jgi:hypothetical protein